MERTDELTRVAAQPSDEQLAALTDVARTMTERPFSLLVTSTKVPKGSVLWAAVKAVA